MPAEEYIRSLKCILCGNEYSEDDAGYVCPDHGYDGRLDVVYDYERIKNEWDRESLAASNDNTIWRYRPLLPVGNDCARAGLPVGGTPLYHAARLGRELGLNNLYIKCDSSNPTASLKDRASIIGVIKAIENNMPVIAAASSGNAAASLAGVAASFGIKSVLFVPRTAPEEKVAQMCLYGAVVFLVNDTYDTAFDLCLRASEEFGWYSRNTGYNPYLSEGKKTVVLEVMEQLDWESPDRIFVPVGDGCILGGVGKGVRDLQAIGWITKIPKLTGVEASGAAALYNAWEKGDENIIEVKPDTIADSIAVGLPRDGIKALRAVRETNGEFIKVSDEEIIKAMKLLAEYSGIFAEPAAAASLAGLVQMVDNKSIDREEKVIILITGSGLKDVKSAIKAASLPIEVEPDFDSIKRAVGKAGIDK
ncbi:threonine synthase [Elusimicrobiota bacterium]